MTGIRAAILQIVGREPEVEVISHPGLPGRDEVLVAMRLAPINPADLLTISGNYVMSGRLPTILGAEGVGEVVAVGEGVHDIACGDRVIPLRRGNWTSLRRLPVRDILRVREDLPWPVAAMLRINPATASRLLDQTKLRPGDWAIQSGGDTAVARLLAILARIRGVNIIVIHNNNITC